MPAGSHDREILHIIMLLRQHQINISDRIWKIMVITDIFGIFRRIGKHIEYRIHNPRGHFLHSPVVIPVVANQQRRRIFRIEVIAAAPVNAHGILTLHLCHQAGYFFARGFFQAELLLQDRHNVVEKAVGLKESVDIDIPHFHPGFRETFEIAARKINTVFCKHSKPLLCGHPGALFRQNSALNCTDQLMEFADLVFHPVCQIKAVKDIWPLGSIRAIIGIFA